MTRKLLVVLLCVAMLFGAYAEGLIVERELIDGTGALDKAVHEIDEFEIGREIAPGTNDYSDCGIKGNAEAVSNDGDFEIINGVLVKYTGAGGDVIVPAGVTAIGDKAFIGCINLTSVIMQSGVKSIGNNAYNGCWNLESVVIPDGVASIGEDAFFCCWNLANINIPASVARIGSGAFSGCSSMTKIIIPYGISRIEGLTFSGCTNLSSVILPDSIVDIEFCAFEQCKALTSIDIPSNVSSIGRNAFFLCEGLINATFPQNLMSIGDMAFSGCTYLADVTIESKNSIAFGGKYLLGMLFPDHLPHPLRNARYQVGAGAWVQCGNDRSRCREGQSRRADLCQDRPDRGQPLLGLRRSAASAEGCAATGREEGQAEPDQGRADRGQDAAIESDADARAQDRGQGEADVDDERSQGRHRDREGQGKGRGRGQGHDHGRDTERKESDVQDHGEGEEISLPRWERRRRCQLLGKVDFAIIACNYRKRRMRYAEDGCIPAFREVRGGGTAYVWRNSRDVGNRQFLGIPHPSLKKILTAFLQIHLPLGGRQMEAQLSGCW